MNNVIVSRAKNILTYTLFTATRFEWCGEKMIASKHCKCIAPSWASSDCSLQFLPQALTVKVNPLGHDSHPISKSVQLISQPKTGSKVLSSQNMENPHQIHSHCVCCRALIAKQILFWLMCNKKNPTQMMTLDYVYMLLVSGGNYSLSPQI